MLSGPFFFHIWIHLSYSLSSTFLLRTYRNIPLAVRDKEGRAELGSGFGARPASRDEKGTTKRGGVQRENSIPWIIPWDRNTGLSGDAHFAARADLLAISFGNIVESFTFIYILALRATFFPDYGPFSPFRRISSVVHRTNLSACARLRFSRTRGRKKKKYYPRWPHCVGSSHGERSAGIVPTPQPPHRTPYPRWVSHPSQHSRNGRIFHTFPSALEWASNERVITASPCNYHNSYL